MASAGSHAQPGVTQVTVNYRLSAPSFKSPQRQLEYRFPQPVHDVCASFAFILTSILPSLFPSSVNNPWEAPNIYVTGSHIGGALATTLALTEPNAISGVAVHHPVADWVSLDEHVVPNAQGKAKKPTVDHNSISAAARSLISTRTELFPTPSAYFDPFASPALFLRAPGRDTPRTHAEALGFLDVGPEDFGDEEIDPSRDTIPEHHSSADALPGFNQATYGPYDDDLPRVMPAPPPAPPGSPGEARPVRRRKVLRRWPPIAQPEDVLLPRFQLFTTPPSPNSDDGLSWLLHKQTDELSVLLRRACFWGRESGFAEERVGLTELGLDENAEAAIARWLGARRDADEADRARDRKLQDAIDRSRRRGT